MLGAQLLGRSSRHICLGTQRALPFSLAPVAFPPCETRSRKFMAPLSPRAGPYSFPHLRQKRMADMSDIVLSIGLIEFIYRSSLRRGPYPPPSGQVSRHRTEIVSSSLDQGSLAERISSSLALCPTLDWLRPLIGPVFGQGLFLSPQCPTQPTAHAGVTPPRDLRAWSVICLS